MEANCAFDDACGPFSPGGHMSLGLTIGGAGHAEYNPGSLIPDFSSKPYEVYCGDALETIRQLKAGGTQFDTVITSPPYFNQRKYGDDPREIGRGTGSGGSLAKVDSYVASLVDVFKEIPLRPWASVWVNIGDKRGPQKGLMGVPLHFFVAMERAGFTLMDNVVWAKEVDLADGKSIGRCMIEPAPRRLNGNGWEFLFRFVLDPEKAWSDTCAVQIPRDRERFFHEGTETPVEQHRYSTRMQCVTALEGRNLTNVWYIGNSRKGENHHAAFPVELIERPVAMTCPEWLVEDGGETKPRERIVEQTVYSEGTRESKRVYGQFSVWQEQHPDESARADEQKTTLETLRKKSGRMDSARHYVPKYPKTTGWTHMDKPVVGPGIVLDPFGGTGTTGDVSVLLGRRFVGIDLYEENAIRMEERCEKAFERLEIERGVN
jgi:DNA modification methylase